MNATNAAGSDFFGGGSALHQLYYPRDVYVDPTGIVYVTDSNNYRVQKWLPGANNGTTVVLGSAGTGLNQFNDSKCFLRVSLIKHSFMHFSERHWRGQQW